MAVRKSRVSGRKFSYPNVRKINSKVNKKILVSYANGGDIEVESDMLKQYKENLKSQENLSKKGWDSKKQLWFPTSAPEKNGGFDIGYGHKIQKGEDFSKGLTNDQVNALLTKDYNTKFKAAGSTFNNRNLNKSWGDLTESEQILLTDYQYNGVLGEFKNFMKAVADEDKETMLKEYERYSGGLTLGKRNDWTKSYIENNINYNTTGTNLGEPVEIEMIDMSKVPYTPKSILETLTQAGSYPKKEYEIKEGDTFYGVANRLENVTKQQLKEANLDIDINTIKTGQKISVPYTFPKSDKVDTPKMAYGGYLPKLKKNRK